MSTCVLENGSRLKKIPKKEGGEDPSGEVVIFNVKNIRSNPNTEDLGTNVNKVKGLYKARVAGRVPKVKKKITVKTIVVFICKISYAVY